MLGAFNHSKKAWLIRCGILLSGVIVCVLLNLLFDKLEQYYSKPITLTFRLPLPEDTAKFYKLPRIPEIKNVRATGYFSDWSETSPYLMRQLSPDTWAIDIRLPLGSNQYKFVLEVNGYSGPVWVYDSKNSNQVIDTWGEINSVAHVPNIPVYRSVTNFLFIGTLVVLAAHLFIAPIIYRVLHWRLAFRFKLMISTMIFIVISNSAFMMYNLYESRELVKQGVIDNLNLVHLVLSGQKIDFENLGNQKEALHAGLADFFWNGKTRVEKSQSSPYQISLSDLALLDTNYRLVHLSHRNQNLILQNQRAKNFGYQNDVDFFMEAVLAPVIEKSRKQHQIKEVIFDHPQAAVNDAEPFDTRRGNFFLGYSTFIKPIYIQGELVGFYAGAIQSKLFGGEIQRVFYIHLILIVLVSAISLFLLATVGRVITHYLSELALWTQQIIKGNFSARVSIKSGDEIQVLAENFDAMRSSLEESFSQIEEKNQLLLHEAYFDSLTSLPNRKKMMMDLTAQPSHGLILINIDAFRGLNGFFGTDIGDKVLKEVAYRLQLITQQPGHKLYKIGPDEFVIVTVHNETASVYSRETIASFTHQACNGIADFCYKIGPNEIYISVTAGVTLAEEPTSPELLVSQAANALRVAKERLFSHLLFDKSMEATQQFEYNMTWASKVKQAIDEDRIVPFFQPIVANHNCEIQKYECLVRLIEKDQTVIGPHIFLAIAKQARLYPFITRIMVNKSFVIFADSPYQFSINLSIDDIIDHQTHQAILTTLARYPEAAKRAIFEITESAEIQNYEVVRAFINEIKTYGCRIAIDDFGSGYSNFAHIMGMNIDYLKIDGSIIKRLDEDKNAQLISRTIADFAKKLGIATIAEFVHSKAVYDKAVEYGIDSSQGYYFGKPEPVLVDKEKP